MKNKALLALALLLLTSTACAQDGAQVEGALPPVRAITRGPRFHWRCDLHPCCTRDGRNVLFDSPHHGGRQVYMADIRKIVAQQQ